MLDLAGYSEPHHYRPHHVFLRYSILALRTETLYMYFDRLLVQTTICRSAGGKFQGKTQEHIDARRCLDDVYYYQVFFTGSGYLPNAF